MALEKLKIRLEDGSEVAVLFNPNQVTIQKASKWQVVPASQRDSPAVQFTYGEPATLTLELFYDTYEAGTDVRLHTDRIFQLTTVEKHGDLHRPPICRLEWGKFNFSDFQWVLQSLNQRFTMFLENGFPVRATLSCTFRQWRSDEVEAKLLNPQSADVAKMCVVHQGETLSSIAAREYNDPTLWRSIARANGIDNPRTLEPGQSLNVPALRARRTTSR